MAVTYKFYAIGRFDVRGLFFAVRLVRPVAGSSRDCIPDDPRARYLIIRRFERADRDTSPRAVKRVP